MQTIPTALKRKGQIQSDTARSAGVRWYPTVRTTSATTADARSRSAQEQYWRQQAGFY